MTSKIADEMANSAELEQTVPLPLEQSDLGLHVNSVLSFLKTLKMKVCTVKSLLNAHALINAHPPRFGC